MTPQAHAGKHSCAWCEGESDFDGSASLRTYGSIYDWHEKFVANGSKDAAKYKNCIRECLVKEDREKLVLDSFPPPELHLHMGAVNTVMDALIAIWGLENVLDWCKTKHIMRRGYQGGTFDGNNSKRILEYTDDLFNAVPVNCRPLVELLQVFEPIVSGTFGHNLDPDFEMLIKDYVNKFLEVQRYCQSMEPPVKLNITWKVHVIAIHLPQFLRKSGVGMARYSEQTAESVHHRMKASFERFCVGEGHPKHAEKLMRAMIEFSSQRI